MTQFVVANNVNTQLASAASSSATSLTLASSANLPTLNTSIGQMMPLTLNDAATGAIYETVYVTAISGATLTVLRGQEGTTALNWNVGDYAFCGPTAGTAGLATMRTQYQASASFSSSQTLTAAIAGESIGFTGSSAAVFSMPGQSTVPSLTPTAVYNDGTATLTLTANGSDKFVVATGQVTSIVMQPGDDLNFYASTTSGLWTAASGSALRQYEPLVIGAATASQHAVQFGQVSGVVGQVRNLVMSVTAASATASLTADEIIVESALSGLRYCLASFSQTINLGTTGANGMDTGTATANGFVGIYAIYNPTTQTAALLGTMESTASLPSVYGGSHMPSGYTASGLVAVVPISSTAGQFAACAVQDRRVEIIPITELNTTTQASSLTALSLSGVPYSAKNVEGLGSIGTSTTNSSATLTISSNAAGVGQSTVSLASAVTSFTRDGWFGAKMLLTARTLYYSAVSSGTMSSCLILVSAYNF